MFFRLFSNKIFSKFIRSKYDSIVVTFKSSTDTHQISAENSRRYLILLVPFWKMISFETNGLRFLVRNGAAFSLACVLPQKQRGMLTRHYYSRYSVIQQPTQWSNIFNKYQHWLHTHSHFLGFASTLWCKKAAWLNSCFNKIKLLCAIVILMWHNKSLFQSFLSKSIFL